MKKLIFILAYLYFQTPARCQYMHTIAGTGVYGYNGDSIAATAAQLNHPESIAFDRHKNLYVCDVMNYRIRRIDSNGNITTYAGVGSPGFNGDSIPATTTLLTADVLAVDSMGNIFFPDANKRIRKIDTNGIITTVGGIGISGYNGDNIPATDAMIDVGGAVGIVIDNDGSIIFSDEGNDRIRKIDATTGYIYTIAGTGVTGYNGDGILAIDAQIFSAEGIAFDTSGNLIFSDIDNFRIRKIDKISGLISTVLGTGIWGYNGDGLPATATQINGVSGLIFDQNNNLFFCDVENNRIRMVHSSDNIVHSIVGTGVAGYNGDGILATDAQVSYPGYLVIDIDGHLVFSDFGNERIRTINGTVCIQNVVDKNKKMALVIYPNPVKNNATVRILNGEWDEKTQIIVVDVYGRKMCVIQPTSGASQTEIMTEQVRVSLHNTTEWNDQVFDKNYPLMPLSQLSPYLKSHHHLPGIPSAEEVVKQGVDLGKMDADLLKKIEELTLYAIQQQKQIDELQKKVELLTKK